MDTFEGSICLPGNDYKESFVKPFLMCLENYFDKPVTYIELLENRSKSLPYSRLEPERYSEYINRQVVGKGPFVFIGTSMGCLHVMNYAHHYPKKVLLIILIEPTIMQEYFPLLYKYESGRGNGEWLKELYEKPNTLDTPSNEEVMGIATSPPYGNNPLTVLAHINIGVVYTLKNNERKSYTPGQNAAKMSYLRFLRNRGHKVFVERFHSDHCIDLNPRYFRALMKFIYKNIIAV